MQRPEIWHKLRYISSQKVIQKVTEWNSSITYSRYYLHASMANELL